jgi:hypothetical protein
MGGRRRSTSYQSARRKQKHKLRIKTGKRGARK